MAFLNSRNCSICNRKWKPSLPFGCSEDNFFLTKNVEVYKKFGRLVSRYLDLDPWYFIPEKTLTREAKSIYLNNNYAKQVCNGCLPVLNSFCRYYRKWQEDQLQMNWCLEQVASLMDKANEKQRRKLKNGLTSAGVDDFRAYFVEQVNLKTQTAFPHLRVPKEIIIPSTEVQSSSDCETFEDDISSESLFLPVIRKLPNRNDSPGVLVPNRDLNGNGTSAKPDKKANSGVPPRIHVQVHIPPKRPRLTLRKSKKTSDNPHPPGQNTNNGYKHLQVASLLKQAQRKSIIYRKAALKSHRCTFCGMRFISKEGLDCHYNRHSSEWKRPFKCKSCQKCFTHATNFRNHIIKSQCQKRISKCKICGKRFRLVQERDNHEQLHRGPTPFMCTNCNKWFANREILYHHQKYHLDARFICRFCGKNLEGRLALLRHESVSHANRKPFPCAICGLKFSVFRERDAHEKEHQEIIDGVIELE